MRRLRIAIVALFILSGISFVGYNVISRLAEDHTPPEISCDSDTVSVSVEDEEIDEALLSGVKASDNEDGDLTDQIVAGSFSRFVTPGVTSLTYVVFDSGNQPASLTREVHFTDYHAPRFTLSNDSGYLDQLSQGDRVTVTLPLKAISSGDAETEDMRTELDSWSSREIDLYRD